MKNPCTRDCPDRAPGCNCEKRKAWKFYRAQAKDEKERAVIKESIEQLSKDFDTVMASIAAARRLIAAYPNTKPAKAMEEMISLFEPELSANPRQLLKQVADETSARG